MSDPFATDRTWLHRWLFDAALPLWWERGADRENGGWFEKIAQDGSPLPVDKRCRVQSRQTFVYAQAKRLGWAGADEAQITHGLEFLRRAYLRDDGVYRKAVTATGDIADDGFDLYDQAFVLLALASGYQALGDPAYRQEAERLLALLGERLGHPGGGFQEDAPPRLPLRSNPHMHMLEAMLAWTEIGDAPAFEARARDIAGLARARFLDPRTGAVGEYFDAEWDPCAGDKGAVREPGHQFEWAFLFGEVGRLLGSDHRDVSMALEAFGRTHGIDKSREAAVFALDADGKVTDPDARLWSQTERMRTSLVLSAKASDEANAEMLRGEGLRAIATLRRFLDVPVAGLWLDRMRPDGTLVEEPAPASSFYHIVSALLPLFGEYPVG